MKQRPIIRGFPEPEPEFAKDAMQDSAHAMQDWAMAARAGGVMVYAGIRAADNSNAVLFSTAADLMNLGIVRCHVRRKSGGTMASEHIIVKRTAEQINRKAAPPPPKAPRHNHVTHK